MQFNRQDLVANMASQNEAKIGVDWHRGNIKVTIPNNQIQLDSMIITLDTYYD